MWNYEKRLEYPINIKQTNPTLAAMIISQYGGPDGELGASMRYISQRYSMPYREVAGLLTDIGTEESAPTIYRSVKNRKTAGFLPDYRIYRQFKFVFMSVSLHFFAIVNMVNDFLEEVIFCFWGG